jgi:hypothetical protein
MTDTTHDPDGHLLHELRNSKGWPTLGNASADRIEELKAELAGGSFYQEKDIDALQDRIEELEAKLAQAIDLSVRIISDPHWRTSDNALWKDLCNFRRVSLAKLKGQDDE